MWENCELREYPGGKFFDSNFGEGEKALIPEKSHANPDGDTADRVFLLSRKEAEKYKAYMQCPIPGEYDARKFRLRGKDNALGSCVDCTNGRMDSNLIYTEGGVRPAIWIRIK